MKYRRTLLKTLAILGPVVIALSSYATEPAHAYDYDWCSYYDYYHDPRCAYPYDYSYPDGGFFFFGGDRRFHHHFDHHHFDHDPRYDSGGFNHGGFNHGGFGGRSGPGMFIPGGGRHGR
jgi:hypothetical protein